MKKWYFILAIFAAVAIPCFAGYYTCKRCGGSGVAGTKSCSACSGSGKQTVTCSTCNGRGEVRDQYGDLQKCSSCYGWGKQQVTCSKCGGRGEEPWVCPVCNGSGKVYVDED